MDVLIIFIIVAFGLFKAIIVIKDKKLTKVALISTFIQTLPFSYGLTIYTFVSNERLGAFGSSIRLELPMVFVFLFIILGYNQISIKSFAIKENRWFYFFIIVCVLSIFNPNNAFPLSPLVPLSFLIQMSILLKIISSNFTREEIFSGIYEGLKVATIFQGILCFLYPVMGVQFVATIFKEGIAEEWAGRREGYVSAVGSFAHPAQLALFSFITMTFFLASRFNKFKDAKVYLYVTINAVIILLTFSRTTYLVLMAVLTILIITFREKRDLFSVRNIFKFTLLFSCILALLYFTPLSDIFLKSDSQEQVENRLVHWILGLEIWQVSKWTGLGINSHVYYMGHKLLTDPFGGTIPLDFFVSNPLHNIHLIVFCELGILGIIIWLFYFVSNIYRYSLNVRTNNNIDNIFNLVFVGLLFSIFIYGFVGWAPFDASITGLCLVLGCFARIQVERQI